MSNTSLLEQFGRYALDFVFPARCIGCGSEDALLCLSCIESLKPTLPPRCTSCWRPGAGDLCLSCQVVPPPFDGLRAAYMYEGLAREIVHSIKYRGFTAVVPRVASLCAQALREQGISFEFIVPVPLHRLRKRARGFNQSELLAQGVSRELGIPLLEGAIERRRRTSPQARTLAVGERQQNVAGAFRARRTVCEGRSLLVIDDVTTTGATLAACAGAIKEAGALEVWAFAFARED